jgi:regulator of RNase E activity RraB
MIVHYQNITDEGSSVEVGVNLDFEKESYETFAQNLLWIFLKIKEGSDAEFKHLFALVDELNGMLKKELDATFAGYRVVEGWFEVYFYAPTAKKFENIIASILTFEQAYEAGSYKDSKYKLYFDELYPDELQFLQIKNSEIIASLKEAGDNHEVPREVEHYLFFATQSNAQRAIAMAETLEFTCKEEMIDDESELRHGIALTQVHKVDEESIDKVTKELVDVAMQEHGVYRGWSTTLIQLRH